MPLDAEAKITLFGIKKAVRYFQLKSKISRLRSLFCRLHGNGLIIRLKTGTPSSKRIRRSKWHTMRSER